MSAILTLKPLIAILQEYADKFGDLEVDVTWEGITRELRRERIYLHKEGTSLFLDADYNHYKDDFAHPDEPDRKPIDRWAKEESEE